MITCLSEYNVDKKTWHSQHCVAWHGLLLVPPVVVLYWCHFGPLHDVKACLVSYWCTAWETGRAKTNLCYVDLLRGKSLVKDLLQWKVFLELWWSVALYFSWILLLSHVLIIMNFSNQPFNVFWDGNQCFWWWIGRKCCCYVKLMVKNHCVINASKSI